MARIRSIHPEQWTDDKFVSCSMEARLLALGGRNMADDNGIFEWNPVKVKMTVFPADSFSPDEVSAFMDELVSTSQVMRFEVSGREYGMVRNFQRFQSPRYPSFKYPVPEELPQGYDLNPAYLKNHSGNGEGGNAESSGGIEGTLPQDCGGVEGVLHQDCGSVEGVLNHGEERRGEERRKHTGDSHPPSASKSYSEDFEACWQAYPKRHRPPNKKDAYKAWKARKGHDNESILAGVKAYASFVEREGSAGTRYVMDPKTFFGPSEHFLDDWGEPDPWAGKTFIADDGHGQMWQRASDGEWFLLGQNPAASSEASHASQ